MLQNKYSVEADLKKSNGEKDLEEIKAKVKSMLANLRFNDGRSLTEVMETMKI